MGVRLSRGPRLLEARDVVSWAISLARFEARSEMEFKNGFEAKNSVFSRARGGEPPVAPEGDSTLDRQSRGYLSALSKN